ncbi:beta subunit of N-acylethanolamine-hydrolyzing acid amidase-domain-containing protein [Aspergillus filifer]
MSRAKTGTFLHHGDPPPTHRINLSLPPSTRYLALAREYKSQLLDITSLFDDLVLSFLPESYLPKIKWLARRFLRRVYDNEENEEIKGIAEATGIEMYLVVALNVLLDLLMGCTSGAALSSPSSHSREGEEPRMLHFRTLEWDMSPLRALLVNLEFVADDDPDSSVLATSITYVGFVGVLTGVRRGLSVSLNFRPNHDDSSWIKQSRFYGGHVAVLLGLRRSISSVLRGLLIPRPATGIGQNTAPGNDEEEEGNQKGRGYLNYLCRFWRTSKPTTQAHALPLDQTVARITRTPSTACYIILSDGRKTTVLEKDRSARSTKTYSSTSFIVVTNSDREMEAALAKNTPKQGPSTSTSMSMASSRQEHTAALITPDDRISMLDLIGDSKERRECMQSKWDKKVDAARRRRAKNPAVTDPLGRTRLARVRMPTPTAAAMQRQGSVSGSSSSLDVQTLTSLPVPVLPGYRGREREQKPAPEPEPEPIVTITPEELIAWTTTYPTTNEMTHFAAVMDPVAGGVLWARVYSEPLDCAGLD